MFKKQTTLKVYLFLDEIAEQCGDQEDNHYQHDDNPQQEMVVVLD